MKIAWGSLLAGVALGFLLRHFLKGKVGGAA
jgi:hypothetical protein